MLTRVNYCISHQYTANIYNEYNILVLIILPPIAHWSLTQPMMQRRPNQTELRLMDSYIQIFCIFQKSKQNVSAPSPLSIKKITLYPILILWGGMVEELFADFFGIYIKSRYKNPSILTPSDSVDVAS